MTANSREVFDRIVLALPWGIGLAVAIGAAFYFGIILQAGVVVIAIAMLWIGWELHRLGNDVREWMVGFAEGYTEAVATAEGRAAWEAAGRRESIAKSRQGN
jgi:hypothetical protein